MLPGTDSSFKDLQLEVVLHTAWMIILKIVMVRVAPGQPDMTLGFVLTLKGLAFSSSAYFV